MQVAEIRWATGHPVNESQSYRMPVNRGVTFIRAETENTASSRFNRLQHNLTHAFGAPNAWETDNTPDVWQFIFEQDDRRYLYSTDQETPAWEPYFRQSVVGKESELLGSQIDLERLADHNLTSKAKRIYLETLMRRYVESYTHLAGANERSGHLALLREELAECEQEIEARKLHTVRDRDLVLAIEEDERRLADLKADDLRLAQDQKKGQLLGSKAEYESLLKLRQQLKETEEREGVYGSRITNPGHNITVHELTELARLRNEVKGIEEEIKGSNDSVEEKRKQLMVIERDRIILAREVMDLEQQKDTLYMALDAEQAIEPVEGEEAQADRDVSFPTSGHLIVLLSLFMMAAGLIVTFFFKIPGLIMIGVAFLIALMIPIRGLQKRLDAARLQQAISRQDTEREEIQDKLRHAQHLVSSSADKLGQYE
ncbi:MAG TPA: hypothetical protein VFD19_01365, partial [Clostridia bacterium]|nr:hypothetical protein [Clostridia bacterium]